MSTWKFWFPSVLMILCARKSPADSYFGDRRGGAMLVPLTNLDWTLDRLRSGQTDTATRLPLPSSEMSSKYFQPVQQTTALGEIKSCQNVNFDCSDISIQFGYCQNQQQCPNASCVWTLASNLTSRIVLDFTYEPDDNDDSLIIYDGGLTSPILATFSGNGNYVSPLKSTGSLLTLLFSSSEAASNFWGTCRQEPIPSGPDSWTCSPRYFYGSDNGTISSTDFEKGWARCSYLVKLPTDPQVVDNSQVLLGFTDINIAVGKADWIEVRDAVGILGRYAGHTAIADIAGASNFMNITVQRLVPGATFNFSLLYSRSYDACACADTRGVSRSGILRLPYYPQLQYCNNMSCVYRIIVDDSCVVLVTFHDFKLAVGDYLALYDGSIAEPNFLIKRLSGTKLPKSAKSTTNIMTIVFTSDNNYVSNGFDIRYEAYCGMSLTNVIGLVVGLLVLAVLFGGSICFCCLRYAAAMRRSHGQEYGSRNSQLDVEVRVTGPNGDTILELPAISPPPTYDIAVTLPVCELTSQSSDDTESAPPPPSYDAVIKAEHDASQRRRRQRERANSDTTNDSGRGTVSGAQDSVSDSEHSF